MKLRVFEAFAGYGSQSIALRNIGVEHEIVAISEIDKYVLQAYYTLHDKNIPNLGDISKIKVEDVPQHDLFTYSFPCQDLSVAGKQKGMIKDKTRSGLLYECEKIIEYHRPKYLLMENVKNLVGKKFKAQFDKWLEYLEGLGYINYWKVLNAKDFGIPQNRERVFVVSILGGHKPYEFPNPIPLDKTIESVLEDKVDEKYYLSDDKVKNMKLNLKGRNPKNPSSRVSGLPTEQMIEINTKGVSNTLTTEQKDNYVFEKYQKPTDKIVMSKLTQMVEVRKYEVDVDKLKGELKKAKEKSKLSIMDIANALNVKKTTVEHWFRNDDCFSIPSKEIWYDLKTLLNIETDEFDKPIIEFELKENKYDMADRVYHINGISPTLTCDTENTAKKILLKESVCPSLTTMQGGNEQPKIVFEQRCDEGMRFFKDNCVGTIRTIDSGGDKRVLEGDCRIRKLTPRECFRLMGLKDSDIDKIQATGFSNSQQYKMAGNSIVINVLEEIFKKLLI